MRSGGGGREDCGAGARSGLRRGGRDGGGGGRVVGIGRRLHGVADREQGHAVRRMCAGRELHPPPVVLALPPSWPRCREVGGDGLATAGRAMRDGDERRPGPRHG